MPRAQTTRRCRDHSCVRTPGSRAANGRIRAGGRRVHERRVHERRCRARSSGLHPGVGRRARPRGRRRARVPRRPGLVQRRLPRRRRVLRAQRLPDHVGAARRLAEERRQPRPRAVLPAPSSPSAPGVARHDHGDVCVRGRVPPGRGVEAPGRRGRVVRLRHELVPDLPPAVVLLGHRSSADAPAPVVTGDRRAVLLAVAVAPGSGAEVLATVAHQARGHHPGCRRCVRAPHGAPVPRRQRPVTRLLRHRHALEWPAHRRRHGGADATVAASRKARKVGADGPGRHRLRGLARARVVLRQRQRVRLVALSRRISRVRRHRGVGRPGRRPPGHHRHQRDTRHLADGLDREALVRHLPVALARVPRDAPRARHPPDRDPPLRVAGGHHGRAGSRVVPLRRGADPQRRA